MAPSRFGSERCKLVLCKKSISSHGVRAGTAVEDRCKPLLVITKFALFSSPLIQGILYPCIHLLNLAMFTSLRSSGRVVAMTTRPSLAFFPFRCSSALMSTMTSQEYWGRTQLKYPLQQLPETPFSSGFRPALGSSSSVPFKVNRTTSQQLPVYTGSLLLYFAVYLIKTRRVPFCVTEWFCSASSCESLS